jgi:hypothetical protein
MKGKKQLGRPRPRRKVNVKMAFEERGYADDNPIHLYRDTTCNYCYEHSGSIIGNALV